MFEVVGEILRIWLLRLARRSSPTSETCSRLGAKHELDRVSLGGFDDDFSALSEDDGIGGNVSVHHDGPEREPNVFADFAVADDGAVAVEDGTFADAGVDVFDAGAG